MSRFAVPALVVSVVLALAAPAAANPPRSLLGIPPLQLGARSLRVDPAPYEHAPPRARRDPLRVEPTLVEAKPAPPPAHVWHHDEPSAAFVVTVEVARIP